MIISIFFIIGVLLLQFVPVNLVALTPGSPLFIIQLITHMFAHANWQHLMGNYMFTFPYALYVEHRVGYKAFIHKWLKCGLVAAASQIGLCLMTHDTASLIGSSGAAFGIVAAALYMIDFNIYAKIAARTVLAYHIFNQAMLAYMMATNPVFRVFVHVAFAAHLGGIITGVILAHQFLRKEKKYKR